MHKKNKIVSLLLALMLLLSIAAFAEPIQTDRAGNEVKIPETIETIVSLSPACTQIIESLGLLDKVIAIDTQTPNYVEGIDALPQFDMMAPDIEKLAALEADVIFTTGMSYLEGNPFQQLIDLGQCVMEVPSSASLDAIKEDILFYTNVLGKNEEGQAIVDEMTQTIQKVADLAKTVTAKKRVMFEIGALPYLYSFGQNTFLHEMIELIGAENVFAEENSWISVTEEAAIASNPDVILTSVNYIEDSIGEILSRQGWENVTALKEKQVYYIDNAASSLPNQYVVNALIEMAQVVYPEIFGQELPLAQ